MLSVTFFFDTGNDIRSRNVIWDTRTLLGSAKWVQKNGEWRNLKCLAFVYLKNMPFWQTQRYKILLIYSHYYGQGRERQHNSPNTLCKPLKRGQYMTIIWNVSDRLLECHSLKPECVLQTVITGAHIQRARSTICSTDGHWDNFMHVGSASGPPEWLAQERTNSRN